MVAGLAGCSRSAVSARGPGSAQRSSSTSTSTPTNAAEEAPASDDGGSAYTRVYRAAIPSIALVRTDRGRGTGFRYDDAHLVTNAHVVEGASIARIRAHDGTWTDGRVRGADPHSDLAVIATDGMPESADPLPFARSPPVIGREVVAIGNPYDLDGTVTSGIVSGVDRLIPSPAGYRIPDAIQTDAAVNPGNSGGPLMSLDGRVVGVVNSKRGDDIAFGISAALTRRVVPRLIETGSYEHAYMGASLEPVTPTVARANGMTRPRGLVVVRTVRDAPAAGVLRPSSVEVVDGVRVPVGGDVVLAIEGRTVESVEDLASHLALRTRPGDTVRLEILRDGSERSVELTLASRPDERRSPFR